MTQEAAVELGSLCEKQSHDSRFDRSSDRHWRILESSVPGGHHV